MVRLLIISLVAIVASGAIVYGVMNFLARDPAQVDVLAQAPRTISVPTRFPTSTPAAASTDTPFSTATPDPTNTPEPALEPTPAATPAPNTPTPTPAAVTPMEREIVVNAFAECNGQYSGSDKDRRAQEANSAIAEGRQTVSEIRALVEQDCGGVFPELTTAAAQPELTPQVQTTATPLSSTSAPTPTGPGSISVPPTPAPIPIVRPVAGTPNLRNIEEKRYMLELINEERTKAGVGTVTLGDNIAAQLHAEASLDGCFTSHWGLDGLKPYMRYSLAGGYQYNAENAHGLSYCIKESDGYEDKGDADSRIMEAMEGWMNSPGHRQNILDPQHKMVSIGIAWDRYNTALYQHFESDYVEYDQLPVISNGILSLSGNTRNGIRFSESQDLTVQIYYDHPPHSLAQGQVARTYCYDSGRQVASLRHPLTGGAFWTTDTFTTTYQPCPSPYDVPAGAPAPSSPAEAHEAWLQAFNASQSRQTQSITIPWITASEWTASGASFAVQADLSEVLNEHGDGVYSLTLWGKIGGASVIISQYSIFHGATPPNTYNQP